MMVWYLDGWVCQFLMGLHKFVDFKSFDILLHNIKLKLNFLFLHACHLHKEIRNTAFNFTLYQNRFYLKTYFLTYEIRLTLFLAQTTDVSFKNAATDWRLDPLNKELTAELSVRALSGTFQTELESPLQRLSCPTGLAQLIILCITYKK